MRTFWLRILVVGMLPFGGVLTYAATTTWDPVDAHHWTGSDAASGIAVEHTYFQGRSCLKGTVLTTGDNYAFAFTDAFHPEEWGSSIQYARADVYITSRNSSTLLKLEQKDIDNAGPQYPASITSAGQWLTLQWGPFSSFPQLERLVLTLDQISGIQPVIYVDNLRVVLTNGTERLWDEMSGARPWFYFGNWFNWRGTNVIGTDIVSSRDGAPGSEAASLYLEWNNLLGQSPGENQAEIGVDHESFAGNSPPLHLDFSDVDRCAAYVKGSSSNVGFRIFLLNTATSNGFASGTTFLTSTGTWQHVVWDLPWPAGFPRSEVDQMNLVVSDITNEPAGWARFDQIEWIGDASVAMPTGLIISINSFDAQHPSVNDLSGDYGALNSDATNRVDLSFDRDITHAGSQASLKVSFSNLTAGSFAGFWNSLIGKPTYPEFTLDVSNWEYLRFYIRGNGESTNILNLKIEIKESSAAGDPYYRTAYQYIQIDESNTNWIPVVLDNDLTNELAWSFNHYPPDPTKIKELVFVLEGFFNPSAGSFHVDDLAFVDTHLPADPVTPDSSDQTFLDYLMSANFQYFRHSVHPLTGLVLDRSSFSDLATVAGTGFGLTCWPLGAQYGLMSRAEAFAYASNALTTLATAPMGSTYTTNVPPAGQIGVNGLFYHFMDTRTGTRIVQTNELGAVINGCELSSIDTAICAFGVTACRQAMTVSNGYTSEQSAQITALADTILGRIDWPFMLQTGGSPQMYMGWKPESSDDYALPHPSGIGFVSSTSTHEYTWDYSTDEALLIAMAGLGSPNPAHRLPPSFMNSWLRETNHFAGCDVVMSHPGTAFTYQFANLWLPLDQMPPDGSGLDWWMNAYNAAHCNYAFSMNSAVHGKYATFDGRSFGPTACEDPSGRYRAFGSAPAGEIPDATSDAVMVDQALALTSTNDPDFVNGTLAPYGAACFVEFLPQETLAALRHYVFDLGLWHGYYGFPDSFHLDLSQYLAREREIGSAASNRLAAHVGIWRNPVQFSIDQGPIVLALGNYLHAGIVQDWVLSNPDVRRAVTNAQTFPPSDFHIAGRTLAVQPGGAAFELTWPAAGFGARYAVQESTNLITGAWQDAAEGADWPVRNRAWVTPPTGTNLFKAYRVITR